MTDALFDAELYDSLDVPDTQVPPIQQRPTIPLSAPNLNSSTFSQNQKQTQKQPTPPTLPPRSSNMNSTDVFFPSSYEGGPGSFLSNFGTDDQLFQQPLLNSIGQNYVPNPRTQQPPLPQQRDTNLNNSYSKPEPQRTSYATTQYSTSNAKPQQPTPVRQTTYDNNDPFAEYHDMYASPPPRLPPIQTSQPPTGTTTQQSYSKVPPQQQPYSDISKPPSTFPSNNRELFFTDHEDDPLEQYSYRQPPPDTNSQRNNDNQDQDTRRQRNYIFIFNYSKSRTYFFLF